VGTWVAFGIKQGWAQGSFVEAEVKAERSRQRRGKAAMSITEARQIEAEAEGSRPRRGRVHRRPF